MEELEVGVGVFRGDDCEACELEVELPFYKVLYVGLFL